MTTATIGLGANTGDRLAALQGAVDRLAARPDVELVATSAVYQTEALVLPGSGPQPDHLNAVVAVRTTLAPRALLRVLHVVERAGGRRPGPRWAPRPLDLDLLLYGDRRIDRDGVTIPHPGLAARRFVLRPLADVVPDAVVPGHGLTVRALLAACPDTARVEPTEFSLAGDARPSAGGAYAKPDRPATS